VGRLGGGEAGWGGGGGRHGGRGWAQVGGGVCEGGWGVGCPRVGPGVGCGVEGCGGGEVDQTRPEGFVCTDDEQASKSHSSQVSSVVRVP